MTTKQPSLDLTLKFINGLKNYNLTYEDIKNNGWKYCGGNSPGRHSNYFRMCYKNASFPETKDKCVCGHHIEENCYITDGTIILVLGNCCIKKFVPSSSRTCEKCGEPHKNRIVNRCNDCRSGICDTCDEECNPSYKNCYNCTFGITNNKNKIHNEEKNTSNEERTKREKETQDMKEKESVEELKKRYYMCPECAEWKVPKEKRRLWTMCKDCYIIQRQKTAINTERHCLDCNIKLPETIEYWKDRCRECYIKT